MGGLNFKKMTCHVAGQYGIARKFYFPFQKSYWCGVSSAKAEGRAYVSNTPDVELGSGGKITAKYLVQ
jgi:hypothetical protein